MAEMFVEGKEDTNNVLVDNEQSYWTKVYDLFETNYRSTMCTCDASTTKRKIHIDNCEFDVSHVHEPQMKWCPILFLDAVVHIVMNNVVTSRQQACIDRRQFNQHGILQQSLEDAMLVDILPIDNVPAMSSDHFEQNMFSSSLRYESGILGTGIAASSSSNYDNDIGSGREMVPSPSYHEAKPLGNLFNKRGDTWSYRAWLNSWGSFDQLSRCLEDFAGSGKSTARHLLAGQSMVQQLRNVPVVRRSSGGASSSSSSGDASSSSSSGVVDGDPTSSQETRVSTFAEVFYYAKMSSRNNTSGAGASSSSSKTAKMEELPTRRSSRRREQKHYASSSYSSLDHRSNYGSSSFSNTRGGGKYREEGLSDGSEEDIVATTTSKRTRVMKSPQHDSFIASDDGGGKMGPSSSSADSEGVGSGMMEMRPIRVISKRQKPLPSERAEGMHIPFPSSSIPAPSATSASFYSTSGLSQLGVHDTLMGQFGYQHEDGVLFENIFDFDDLQRPSSSGENNNKTTSSSSSDS